MSETDIPLQISYTDKDVANAAKYDRWKTGSYRGILSEIARQVSKEKPGNPGGHLMFKCQYKILKDPNDAGSIFGPTVFYYQCLPFRNPNVDGHVPAKFFARSTNQWLSAHDESVIALPTKDVDGNNMFKGETIEPSEVEASKKEAYDTTYEKAAAMWEDESNETMEALKGSCVYFDIVYAKGSEFASVQNFRRELGEGEELTDAATALETPSEDEAPAEEAVETKANGKTNGHTNGKVAKATAKPAPKAAKAVAGKRK